MCRHIFAFVAVIALSSAYRLPRAIESPPGDFTDNGNGIDPIIDLRKLSAYLLQRLPAVTADKIIISLAKDASDRSMDEQIQGFHDVINLLVKGAWARVIRRNENESPEVKNHMFEAFLLQQVSAVEADKIMNALLKMEYGSAPEERNDGFTNIVNLLADGVAAKIELKKLGQTIPISETDVIGKLREYLLKRVPSTEADRIVNLFGKYLQADNVDQKRDANRQLIDILVDGALAQIALDGVASTQILNPSMANAMEGLYFMSNIEQAQKILIEKMPYDELNRILNVVLRIASGKTSDDRNQAEWEIFDMLVEGAQAKEALHDRLQSVPESSASAEASITPTISTTTDMPTYFVTFD